MKCNNYRTLKSQVYLEQYLTQVVMMNQAFSSSWGGALEASLVLQLALCYKYAVTKFRCRNLRLPIEAGRFASIDKNVRWAHCTFCTNREVSDELHYINKCTRFTEERRRYLEKHFLSRSNILKFEQLINNQRT